MAWNLTEIYSYTGRLITQVYQDCVNSAIDVYTHGLIYRSQRTKTYTCSSPGSTLYQLGSNSSGGEAKQGTIHGILIPFGSRSKMLLQGTWKGVPPHHRTIVMPWVIAPLANTDRIDPLVRILTWIFLHWGMTVLTDNIQQVYNSLEDHGRVCVSWGYTVPLFTRPVEFRTCQPEWHSIPRMRLHRPASAHAALSCRYRLQR